MKLFLVIKMRLLVLVKIMENNAAKGREMVDRLDEIQY